MAFLASLALVASSTYVKVSQGVTLEQLDRNSRTNRMLLKQALHQINRVVASTAAPEGWRPDTTARLERIEAELKQLRAEAARTQREERQ